MEINEAAGYNLKYGPSTGSWVWAARDPGAVAAQGCSFLTYLRQSQKKKPFIIITLTHPQNPNSSSTYKTRRAIKESNLQSADLAKVRTRVDPHNSPFEKCQTLSAVDVVIRVMGK